MSLRMKKTTTKDVWDFIERPLSLSTSGVSGDIGYSTFYGIRHFFDRLFYVSREVFTTVEEELECLT